MSKGSHNRFVVDGRKRVIAGSLREIRSRVRAKYAEEMAAASLLRRWLLRLKIRREIGKELDRIAPRDGLYARR